MRDLYDRISVGEVGRGEFDISSVASFETLLDWVHEEMLQCRFVASINESDRIQVQLHVHLSKSNFGSLLPTATTSQQ